MRTLIVDDDHGSRRILEKMLAEYAECESVPDGLRAVEAFIAAHEAGHPFDLVCLDIMMPVMNGRQALKKIRDYEEKQGISPDNQAVILMTTSVADKKEVILAMKEGATWYLVKPVSRETLIGELRKNNLTYITSI